MIQSLITILQSGLFLESDITQNRPKEVKRLKAEKTYIEFRHVAQLRLLPPASVAR